jgi:hypothetical protein
MRLLIHNIYLYLLVSLCFGISLAYGQTQSTRVPDEKTRLTVFISDLHLGPGKDDTGKEWLKIEDFRWEKEFDDFTNFIAKENDNNTDLVIIGDMLELWQSSQMVCSGEGTNLKCKVLDCEHGGDLGCTEEEALARTERVIKQHDLVFKSLKRFVQNGTNTVVILPGNHDAALFYPELAKTVLVAIAPGPILDTDCKPGQRVCISKNGYWLSQDGLIFADHGHVFDEANRFKNWPIPFMTKGGETYLERPFGEQMVQQFYNMYEQQFPILDNFSKESEGLHYIVASDGFSGAGKGVVDFFRFLLYDLSWKQRVAFLGPEDRALRSPDWNVERISKEFDVDFLISSLSSDDKIRKIAEDNKKEIKVMPKDLSPEAIRELCDYREMLRSADNTNKPDSCPIKSGELGYVATKALNREEINMKKHLDSTYGAIRALNKKAPAFRIYIFGHTHAREHKSVDVDEGGGWPIEVYNTGAFQRVVTRDQMDKIKDLKKPLQGTKLTDAEVLTSIRPEDLPPCYTFVRIDPYKKEADPIKAKPEAKLMYWTVSSDGKWIQDTECRLPK